MKMIVVYYNYVIHTSLSAIFYIIDNYHRLLVTEPLEQVTSL